MASSVVVHYCFSQGKSLNMMEMMIHQKHELSSPSCLYLYWCHYFPNKGKLHWVTGTLTWWNMASISPITPICSSLNLSSTPLIWFVRSGPRTSSIFNHVPIFCTWPIKAIQAVYVTNLIAIKQVTSTSWELAIGHIQSL